MSNDFERWWAALYPYTLEGKTAAHAAWIVACNHGYAKGLADGYTEGYDDRGMEENEDWSG